MRRLAGFRSLRRRLGVCHSAEYLFSRHGLHGVTLKDIARQADMHTSLLHYYFDDAVFARPAEVTASLRMAALHKEGALHAYIDADLNLFGNGGEGWRDHATLGAQASIRWCSG